MPREIIAKPCSKRPQRIAVTCPWCGREIAIEKKSTAQCHCGALHRWNGSTMYHIPKVK